MPKSTLCVYLTRILLHIHFYIQLKNWFVGLSLYKLIALNWTVLKAPYHRMTTTPTMTDLGTKMTDQEIVMTDQETVMMDQETVTMDQEMATMMKITKKKMQKKR